ncbi:MAG: SulP family inorganic anion transporter [Propionibacteriaceae bacterium]
MPSRWSGLVSSARSWARDIRPRRRDLKRDLIAAIPSAIAAVPDGMANGVLAGVNPVQGLYASMAGRVAGGLTASTKMMVITTTSAAALTAGSAIGSVPEAQRADALIWLTLIAGALMLVAGAVGLSRYVRFVSQSVMLGFLTGLSVNIFCGQLPALTGSPSQGNFALTKALNVVLHPTRLHLPSVAVGLGAILLLVVLSRTRLASIASLAALGIPTAIVVLAGISGVATVADLGVIPRGLPLPQLPALSSLTPTVVSGSLAVAALVVVQGAGVAEAAPNPDGTRSRAGRDFRAQGIANLTAGVFGGQPVGGSVSSTALNTSVGAQSRWASIWSGVGVALVLIVFSGAVGHVLMPCLAAFLIFAAVKSFKPAELWSVGHAGPNSLVALAVTMVATLLLPVAAAVAVGVGVSILLQLNQEAVDLRVVELYPLPADRFAERPPPKQLVTDSIVILDVYGSLFFAGSKTLQHLLPQVGAAANVSVIIRLRGRTTLGSTFLTVISAYADQLQNNGGRLYLTGLDPAVLKVWEAEPLTRRLTGVQLYPATEIVGGGTRSALLDANARRLHRD